MAKQAQAVEILASRDWEGPYGFHGNTRLVRSGRGVYAVQDRWCGEGSLEGECLREYVYYVPAERVAELVALVGAGDDGPDDDFREEVADLRCMGRLADLAYARGW